MLYQQPSQGAEAAEHCSSAISPLALRQRLARGGAGGVLAKERPVLGRHWVYGGGRRRISKPRKKASLVGEATFLTCEAGGWRPAALGWGGKCCGRSVRRGSLGSHAREAEGSYRVAARAPIGRATPYEAGPTNENTRFAGQLVFVETNNSTNRNQPKKAPSNTLRAFKWRRGDSNPR